MAKDEGERIGVVAALVRSAFLVNTAYAEAAHAYGLTPQQGQLLCVLMPGPTGMGELGAKLGLAKSSLTGLVDRTSRLGFVERAADPDDRRAVRVALTGEGARLADVFYTEACRRIELLPAGLDDPERELLAGLLGRVVLDNEVPEVFSDRP
ncbi:MULTISPECIES: MarR family winged helix-turn-helix transcriptional regulator [unclassified Streptomyces]|uniref:MarR family winged helix-turn-helix transcriptional regulator n=1 Tax=unclassified Streptomyces TaxID=2593676 RepID=UPI0004CB4F22|nr:MarR family transcriptional regulator [Streptomyces sp. NRRL F-5727]